MPVLRDAKSPRLYDEKYPSVTEVLNVISKPHLDSWRKRVGHKVADEASSVATNLGTKVHGLCQTVSHGKEHSEEDPQLVAMVTGYQEFLQEYVDHVVATEKRFVSSVLGVGGTLDAYVVLKDGTTAVVDIKTSRQFNPEMGLQLGAYMAMCEENGWPVDNRIVVRLRKDKPGKWHVKFYEQHQRDREAFAAAVTLWKWVHQWYPEVV